MNKITDTDIIEKIAIVEGLTWMEEQNEADASMMFTVKWAVEKAKSGLSPVIYGFCSTHRYLVRKDGEVMFSAHHGRGRINAARSAGFNIHM